MSAEPFTDYERDNASRTRRECGCWEEEIGLAKQAEGVVFSEAGGLVEAVASHNQRCLSRLSLSNTLTSLRLP